MNKTETGTKGSRRHERGKKSHEKYMKRLKEKILKYNQLSTSSPTDRPTPSTSSSTNNSTSSTSSCTDMFIPSTPSSTDNSTPSTSFCTNRFTPSTPSSTDNFTPSTSSCTAGSNDTYVYGIGILAVLANGVYFAYKTFQAANKKQVNEKQNQPPK